MPTLILISLLSCSIGNVWTCWYIIHQSLQCLCFLFSPVLGILKLQEPQNTYYLPCLFPMYMLIMLLIGDSGVCSCQITEWLFCDPGALPSTTYWSGADALCIEPHTTVCCKRAWAPLGGAPRALNNVSNWFSFPCHLCLTIPWQDWHMFMMKSFLEPTFYDFSLVWFMSNLQIRGMAHWLIFFNQVLSGPRKHGCLCIRISYGNYLHIVLTRQLWFLFRIAETADLVSKNGLLGHSSSRVMISGSHITPSFSYALWIHPTCNHLHKGVRDGS